MVAEPDPEQLEQAMRGGKLPASGKGAAGAAAPVAGSAPGPTPGPEAGRRSGPREVRDCGDLDMHIARDGSWFYRGTPINRMPLVKLFSTVLQRDAEGTYWLITPAERGRITVEDAPFVAVELTAEGTGRDQALIFRTNLDDTVAADEAHPLRVATDAASGAPRPYILVRGRLEALIARPVFYQLVDLGTEERVGDATLFGVWSKGRFFPLGKLGDAH